MNKVSLNLKEFKELKKQLVIFKNARVRVGVMGKKVDRFDINTSTKTVDDLNNPTLGLIHEFGTQGNPAAGVPAIPERSFLRMPLFSRLPKKIDAIGRDVWRNLVIKKGPLIALKQLGVLGENIVQEAFATRGFGSWVPNAPMTVKRKGSSAPLIDTAQLRRSVTSEVVPGKNTP